MENARLRILLHVVLSIAHCLNSSSPVACSRVLGIFPVVSKSHFAVHRAIMEGLASRGHQVTVMSFFDDDNESKSESETESDASANYNYRSIKLDNLDGGVDVYVDTVTPADAAQYTGIDFYLDMIWFSTQEKNMCAIVLSHEYVRNLNNKTAWPPLPELLIVESFHLPCFASLAEKYDIPLIVSLTLPYAAGMDYAIGNPLNPSYWPSVSTDYTQIMNFGQRLVNWLHLASIYAVHHLRITAGNALLDMDEKYVGNRRANVTNEKLYGRISLIFANNHFSFLNRPSVPNSIDIGGIHIKPPKPLPPEIRQFVEAATDGVIFFSFGTTIKMSGLSQEKIETFRRVFSDIPQRILWRSDIVNLTNASSNVMIGKWFPQRDILEHKNVKAFISHGGICSTFEAIHTGKPIIGIPFLYDQFTNVNILKENGVAIRLDYDNLDYQTLLEATRNILIDRRYQENMRKLSAIFKDRPMSPLDTAIYWAEYVIKHKGAPHMRVISADRPLYQFLLLDVIGSILLCLLFTMCAFSCVVKRTFRRHLSLKNKKNQ